jgi:DNA-binding NarL/FixJ family response regulator
MLSPITPNPVDEIKSQSLVIGVSPVPAWHHHFLQILPAIRSQAAAAFRKADPAAREEAIQEVVANTLVAYARLVDQDKVQLAFAPSLAGYAIAQVRAGRKVGSRLNVRDVSSAYCRAKKGVRLESLDQQVSEEWMEITAESRRATPAEIATIRIDFTDWLATLTPRNRRLAERLAAGETTSAAACALGVSRGRISQLRAELRNAWHFFQGEPLSGLA